ncbi:hypothetical protein TNCV_4468511 [Trichonephila clavipes]|nr:hypothetical protein TNCV_4468511 [Trichonephila clavipes]
MRTRPCVRPLRFSLQNVPVPGSKKVSVGVGKRENLAHSVTVKILPVSMGFTQHPQLVIHLHDFNRHVFVLKKVVSNSVIAAYRFKPIGVITQVRFDTTTDLFQNSCEEFRNCRNRKTRSNERNR